MARIKILYVLLGLPFIISVISGQDTFQSNKIAGGHNTKISFHPYAAILEVRKNRAYQCALAIIADRWLTSVANCLKGWNPVKEGLVRAGSSFVGRGGTEYDIRHVYPFPKHDTATGANNFGLVETVQSMEPFNKTVNRQKISVAGPTFIILPGMEIVYTGWGMTSNVKKAASILQEAKAIVIKNYDCDLAYAKLKWRYWSINPSEFCVNATTGAGCRGDGGAPAVYNGNLIGVFSSAYSSIYNCVTSKNPNIFTKVSMFFVWMLKTVKQNL